MISTTSHPRFSSCADFPSNSAGDRHGDDLALGRQRPIVNSYGCEHAAKAARGAVFAEFGRNAFALDQADFIDRKPAERCGLIFVGSRFDGT